MPVEIICPDCVCNQLKKLNRNTAKHILKSIRNINEYPKDDIYRIANSSYYKMRIGDFQIIFDIQDANLRILAILPPPRG
jgi:mRNA-degrading endonuclease RelE of RelBE toxin-antitoxin system